MRSKRLRTMAVAAIGVLAQAHAHSYEINNHADMSDTSALRSSLADLSTNGKLFRIGLKARRIDDPLQTFPLTLGLPEQRKCFGELDNGAQEPGTSQPGWGASAGRTNLQIVQLFRYGACYEDNEGINPLINQRPLAHFYDPQHGGRGLTDIAIGTVPSSVDWVLNPAAFSSQTGANHYGWKDARGFFYDALTKKSDLASVNAADNELLRKLSWGQTFQSLGHIVHHLQDMAQPQHVRNDAHCDATACVGPAYKPSGYEKFWQGRADIIRGLAATATAPIMFGLPREFWNMNIDDQLRTTNAPDHMSPQSGLAAYTSTNFVSAGTDFTIERDGATRTNLPSYEFGLPRPAVLPNDVSLATLFTDSSPTTQEQIRTKVCGGDLTTCKMRFYGSEVDPTARKSAISYFSQEYLGAAITPTRGRAGYFTQNYWTYADAATKLIPKAVEYSAGLINYFFRGEMQIDLPDEGVYGVLDHAVEKTKGIDGFRFIKLKLKNVTEPLSRGSTSLPQDMTGEFRLVAKFRRNTCYTPNLYGQIGTIGSGTDGAAVITNSPDTCRSAVDEIVVSNAETTPTPLVSGGPAMTMSFDFPNPIPIEATDLFLQVVFKGKLGEEEGAVAVATKDVSEPSFVGFMDSSDYKLCDSVFRANGSDPYDEIGCARWSPDSGPSPLVEPANSGEIWPAFAASNSPEYGRWLGVSDDKNVVLARLPTAGIPAGGYVRLAVIADATSSDLRLWHGAATSSSLPYTRAPVQGPFAVNDADYWRWQSRVKLTSVQADVSGAVPVASLPRYWRVRGVVLSARRAANEVAQNELPTLMIYRGEPLWGGDVTMFMNGGPTQPNDISVLERSYYPAITSNPVKLDRIAFERAVVNRVPATYESVTTPRPDVLLDYPVWSDFFAKSFAWRHQMSPRASRLTLQ